MEREIYYFTGFVDTARGADAMCAQSSKTSTAHPLDTKIYIFMVIIPHTVAKYAMWKTCKLSSRKFNIL